ncbi:histidine utilization repressor [Iodidimonas nitroreducens]|uniref:Histidine utilization repressor n=1 Tax=Iodidimonas nitroreducens TaxID=1236968 RepID=A0A5A7NEM1_9PROT|nr:histidine utilization repressor [Iodidimonas nitroreducens]GAK33326.1 histidine utilization repressor [alpha proteobacterium Q-1]GER05396.1 histidine utilization repressor [Iodidimonas nitroreducens]
MIAKKALPSAQPLYKMVKAHVLSMIEDGRLKANDRAPSESELVQSLGVSRMTANRALKELSEAGFVTRVPGLGTFVAERRTHGTLLTIRDIADELSEGGNQHHARVLRQIKEPASETIAARFRMAVGSPLFHAEILHLQNDQPILLEDRYVQPQIAPDYLSLDLEKMTSYRYLVDVAPLQEVEHRISAIPASDDLRLLLALAPNEPCLLIRRRTWTGGMVASCVDLIHAGSRYDITGRFKP